MAGIVVASAVVASVVTEVFSLEEAAVVLSAFDEDELFELPQAVRSEQADSTAIRLSFFI